MEGSVGGRVDVVALSADAYSAAIDDLTRLLLDAIASGASVNFLAGATPLEVRAWWKARGNLVRSGIITPFVATLSGDPSAVGCALLVRSSNQNAPHRAEIAKVLVHSSARRRGVGRALMTAAEALARAEGRWLLHLDTEAGSVAEAMYRALGWHEMGTMPNHALRTDGTPWPTVFFWKDLRA